MSKRTNWKPHSIGLEGGALPGGVLILLAATLMLIGSITPSPARGAWTLPATSLTQAGQDANNPELAIGPDGTTTVVWVRSNGTNDIIQASTRPAGATTFSVPVDLSLPGGNAGGPQVAIGPDGTTTVVWYRQVGSDTLIQAATRAVGTSSFSSPENISQAGGDAYYPSIATGPDGATTAVWSRLAGGSDFAQVATRPAGSNTFSTPVDISAASTSVSYQSVVAAPDGTASVVWRRSLGATTTIQATTRVAGSTNFSTPVDLSVAPGTPTEPEIAVGADNTTTVVWHQGTGGADTVLSASRPAGALGYSAPTPLSQGGIYSRSPAVATGPDGTTTATWYTYDGTSVRIQTATRQNGGSAFSAPVNISDGAGSSYNPDIAIGFDGTTNVAWYQFDGGESFIRASTRTAGSDSFSQPVSLSAPGGDAYSPKLATGPCSTFTTSAWERSDGTDYYVQEASEPTAACTPTLDRPVVRGPKRVKTGKKTIFRVDLANSGDGDAVGVKVRVTGKGRKATRQVGTLSANGSKTVKVPLRFKKTGKVKLTFKVTASNAGSKSAKKTVKVVK